MMDEKGVTTGTYKPTEEGNGSVPTSVAYKTSATSFSSREKLLLAFSLILAICTLTLIVGLVVRLGKDPQSCSSEVKSSSPDGDIRKVRDKVCTTKDCVREAAALIHAIDFDVDPCDDFYEFACGNWIRNRMIPDDKSVYLRFTEVADSVQLKLRVQLEQPITDDDISAVRKMKTLYSSCTNEELISKRGLKVTDDLLRELGGWPVTSRSWDESKFNLEELLVKLGLYNNFILINVNISPDDKNSSVYIIVIDQSNLGMPSRDYYLKPRDDKRLRVYEQMAVDVAVLFGADETEANAQMKEMVDFEITVAKLMLPPAEHRNMDKLYHKMTIAELDTNVPGFRWLDYLQGLYHPFNLTITDDEPVVVYTPVYLADMLKVVKKTPKRTLSNYLIWRIMMNRINNLGERIRDVKRDYNRIVYGSKKEQPKWRTCVEHINMNMGSAVGRIFIDNYFDKEAKKNAITMIHYLRESFVNLIKRATWMDKQTTSYALKKADAILEKIGYPETMLNNTYLNEEYRDVDFKANMFFENVLILTRNIVKDNANRLRTRVDREAWTTTPAIVNAFYSVSRNSITFPAAILQPPFYSKEYPMSLIFGGIGMVIGHEITHGFDDEGRQYDMIGNLHHWWTNSSLMQFNEMAQCIVDQYSAFEINGEHVNGKMTLGENMADNSGIKASLEAYRTWVSVNGEEPLLPGLDLTHEQLFFVNFAQGWCSLSTDAALHNQIVTDPHSPFNFRVIGTVSNSEYFRDAYKCPPGSKMNPSTKCGVW